MRPASRIWLATATTLLTLTSVVGVRGDYSYRYVVSPTPNIIDPNSSVVLNVALQERVTGASVSRLATDGLIGAGVRLAFSGNAAQIASVNDITFNSTFDGGFQSRTLNPDAADLTETVDFTSPAVFGSSLGNGIYQVLLGTFRFTAGPNFTRATPVIATDIAATDDTITGSGFVLDNLIGNGSAFVFTTPGGTAVPEPSSLALLVVSASCVGSIRRVRRRAVRRRPDQPDF